MKKYPAFVFFILICAVCGAQDGAYLIPRRIFIGDNAVLVVPLPPSNHDSADIVLTPGSSEFPPDENIDFHRIVLERRRSGGRLLIEFTAFVPGFLQLPVIEIGGERFAGLAVTVNSVIDSRAAPVLSGPASSLAMPGTGLLIYGSMAAFVLFILLAIWFLLKGRVFLRELGEKWKRRMLFYAMKKTETRLHRALLRGGNKRVILDELSQDFRRFLTIFTGNNCSSMTAAEFENLPDVNFGGHDFSLSPLGNFFHGCDELRFSGADVSSQNILSLLDDLRLFIGSLENAGRDRQEAGA